MYLVCYGTDHPPSKSRSELQAIEIARIIISMHTKKYDNILSFGQAHLKNFRASVSKRLFIFLRDWSKLIRDHRQGAKTFFEWKNRGEGGHFFLIWGRRDFFNNILKIKISFFKKKHLWSQKVCWIKWFVSVHWRMIHAINT